MFTDGSTKRSFYFFPRSTCPGAAETEREDLPLLANFIYKNKEIRYINDFNTGLEMKLVVYFAGA